MALSRQLLCEPRDTQNVSVVSLTDLGDLGGPLKAQGYTVHTLGLAGAFSLVTVFFKLLGLFRREKPDVVQTWMYHADLIGGLAARLSGCKKIYWGVRCTTVPIGSRVTYWLMKTCARLSRLVPYKVICVADAAKQSHIEYGYDPSKLVVIGNGFEIERFDRHKLLNSGQQINFKKQDNELVIGCVGRFHPDKGQDLLIAAAKQLVELVTAEQLALKLRFVLVGRDCDQQNQQLIELVESEQLTDNFTLYGQSNNVPAVLAGFDISCMPSRTEGFPNGLGEAMAMGVPCVATDVGDAKALGGDTVTVVTSHDVNALTQGLLEMIKMTNGQRELLGQRCAARIRQHYSIESVKAKFKLLISEQC